MSTLAAGNLRRRLHHSDVDGRKYEHIGSSASDSLSEPLLGSNSYSDNRLDVYDHRREEDIWDDRKKEESHWTFVFSQLIAQWAQWLANIVIGSSSVLGRLFTFPAALNGHENKNLLQCLTPLQEERLRNLKKRVAIPFDGSHLDHQDALTQLWRLAYPERELPPLKSELWKDMGWQGSDPSTDFRGGGFISLENLIYFAQNYPETFQRLLHKEEGVRAQWEYPFAVAGINISFMLVQMLDLQSGAPTSTAAVHFFQLLGEDEMAFDKLYCVAFKLMDAQWLAKRASYMEFNDVLKSTRTQLERELALEDVTSVSDLPAYTMLCR